MCFIQNGCILLQNLHIISKIREIIWFLQYNVIHSPTSLSAIVKFYEYIFSSHPFFFFFLRVLLRFSVIWTKLMDLSRYGEYGICVAFSIWIFFTEAGFNAYSCLLMILGVPFELVQGHQTLSRVDGEIGVFGIVVRPTRVPVEFQCETGLLLSCNGNVRIPFQTKQGN